MRKVMKLASRTHPFDEHNSACERAQLSDCRCYCRGAGHQKDLIERAVSCTTEGKNNLINLLKNLEEVYGGFHADFFDEKTPTRRKARDLQSATLGSGRGATRQETLTLDEALHASFIRIARESTGLNDTEREQRRSFVEELTEAAFYHVGADLDTHNFINGHLWCSIQTEASSYLPGGIPSRLPARSSHGAICYPRRREAFKPKDLDVLRDGGVQLIRDQSVKHPGLVGRDEILRLMAAASCPDLWHHPGAVRYALLPFVLSPTWPPRNTTTLALKSNLTVLEKRWDKNGFW